MTKYLCCFLIARLVAWQPTGKLMNSRRPHRSTTFTFGQVDRRSEEGLGGQIPAGVTCFVFFLFFLLGRKCSAARQCQCQKSDIGRLRHYRNILITQSPNLKRGRILRKTPASWKSACQSAQIPADHDFAVQWSRSGGNIATKPWPQIGLIGAGLKSICDGLGPRIVRSIDRLASVWLSSDWKSENWLADWRTKSAEQVLSTWGWGTNEPRKCSTKHMAHNYPTDSDDVLRNAKIQASFRGWELGDTVEMLFSTLSKVK